MAEGRRPAIYGDGRQTRDFTYVANVVQANLKALRSGQPLGGEALNVGTGLRITLLDLVDAINKSLGTSLEPEFRPKLEPELGVLAWSLQQPIRVVGVIQFVPEQPKLRILTELRVLTKLWVLTKLGLVSKLRLLTELGIITQHAELRLVRRVKFLPRRRLPVSLLP